MGQTVGPLIKMEDMYNPALTFPAKKWIKWFAWYPVRIHDKLVWLRFVYRHRSRIRFSSDYTEGGPYTVWIYGNIFDVLSK